MQISLKGTVDIFATLLENCGWHSSRCVGWTLELSISTISKVHVIHCRKGLLDNPCFVWNVLVCLLHDKHLHGLEQQQDCGFKSWFATFWHQLSSSIILFQERYQIWHSWTSRKLSWSKEKSEKWTSAMDKVISCISHVWKW